MSIHIWGIFEWIFWKFYHSENCRLKEGIPPIRKKIYIWFGPSSQSKISGTRVLGNLIFYSHNMINIILSGEMKISIILWWQCSLAYLKLPYISVTRNKTITSFQIVHWHLSIYLSIYLSLSIYIYIYIYIYILHAHMKLGEVYKHCFFSPTCHTIVSCPVHLF